MAKRARPLLDIEPPWLFLRPLLSAVLATQHVAAFLLACEVHAVLPEASKCSGGQPHHHKQGVDGEHGKMPLQIAPVISVERSDEAIHVSACALWIASLRSQ